MSQKENERSFMKKKQYCAGALGTETYDSSFLADSRKEAAQLFARENECQDCCHS